MSCTNLACCCLICMITCVNNYEDNYIPLVVKNIITPPGIFSSTQDEGGSDAGDDVPCD